MNQEHREPQKQQADDETSASNPPISGAPSKPANNPHASKSENSGEPSKDLHQITLMDRFKEWLSKITVAEVGMLILTAVIATSSYYYTKYAKRQLKVIGTQITQSQQTICQNWQQMAVTQKGYSSWVYIPEHEHVVVSFSPGHEPFVQWQTKLINAGSTPALEVVHKSALTTFDKYLLDKTELLSTERWDKNVPIAQSKAVLLPGKEISLAPVKLYIGPKTQEKLRNRELLYIFGRITYIDVFRLHHAAYYCERLINGGFEQCNEGNYLEYEDPPPPAGCPATKTE